MITVKFFGLLSVDSGIKQIALESKSAKETVDKIIDKYPNISKKQLLSSVIFINKKQITSKRGLSTKLNDGDEIVFISPTSGGWY